MNYNLDRIRKIELLLLPETKQTYLEARVRGDIELSATTLLKIGDLELELQERYASHFKDCALKGRVVEGIAYG